VLLPAKCQGDADSEVDLCGMKRQLYRVPLATKVQTIPCLSLVQLTFLINLPLQIVVCLSAISTWPVKQVTGYMCLA